MADEDTELVALIDNELEGDAKSHLIARLEADDALRKRYEALRDGGALIATSLQTLLERAPLGRLRAALPPERAPRAASRLFSGIGLRDFAAGIVVGLLAAGAAAWVAFSFAPEIEREDWRAAVIEYMELYNNETFAVSNPDASLQAKELSAVGAYVGADLTPESVALSGLRFKAAQVLSYDGSPLGEIAYVDAQGAPLLFCVIANGAADAPMRSERRGEFSLSSWSRAGRGYLVHRFHETNPMRRIHFP